MSALIPRSARSPILAVAALGLVIGLGAHAGQAGHAGSVEALSATTTFEPAGPDTARAADRRVALTGGWTLAPALANGGRPAPKAHRPSSPPWSFRDILATCFEDAAWYRLALGIETAGRDGRATLEFDGMPLDATVFVNGTEVARQAGDWTPFTADLTRYLRMDGTDLLEVRVVRQMDHNSRWRARLSQFRSHVKERRARGPGPLLSLEAVAEEPGTDPTVRSVTEPTGRTSGEKRPTRRTPLAPADMRLIGALARERFGSGSVTSLFSDLRAYTSANRKYQIERMALDLPHTRFDTSAGGGATGPRPARGMPGKTTVERKEAGAQLPDWLADTMVLLDDDEDRRAFRAGDATRVRLRHFGSGDLRGDLVVSLDGVPFATAPDLSLRSGESSRSFPIVIPRDPVDGPRPVILEARLLGTHAALNRWRLWLLPRTPAATGLTRKVAALDAQTLAFVEAGGGALIAVNGGGGGFPVHSPPFDTGAPFLPPHPLHERVPAQMLKDLLAFDLGSIPALRGAPLQGQVDPIIVRWNTRGPDKIVESLHAFTARLGEGRVLVTTLNLESDAGRWLEAAFLAHLAEGPAPEHTLTWRPD